MPLDEWDIFFAGSENFETDRDSFAFFEIEHNYRWFRRMIAEYPKEFGIDNDESDAANAESKDGEEWVKAK